MISLIETWAVPQHMDARELAMSGLVALGAPQVEAGMRAFLNYRPAELQGCFLGLACGSADRALRSDEIFGLTRMEAIALMELYDDHPDELKEMAERYLEAQQPLQTSCGWCGERLQEGRLIEGKESTGICPPCAAVHFPAEVSGEPAYV